jgi:mannose-6-phosphate isomerase-like protein (cupin superfamily)
MRHIPAFDLGAFSAFVSPDGQISREEVTDDFWTRRVLEFGAGQLISSFPTIFSWPSWEMHPNGDELIFQTSGITEFIVEGFDAPTILRAGCFLIVPKGHWHTANCIEAGEAVYVTNGEGTQHRSR